MSKVLDKAIKAVADEDPNAYGRAMIEYDKAEKSRRDFLLHFKLAVQYAKQSGDPTAMKTVNELMNFRM